MSNDAIEPVRLSPPPSANWAGLTVAILACGLQYGTKMIETPIIGAFSAIAASLSVAGLILAGYGVSRQPRNLFVLMLAAATCFAAAGGFREEWDSIRLVPKV